MVLASAVCAVGMPIAHRDAAADDQATGDWETFVNNNRTLSLAYGQFSMIAEMTEIRHDNVDSTGILTELEFIRSDQKTRLTLRYPDDPERPERVMVCDPEGISFAVDKHTDGRQVVRFVSPRRGYGHESVENGITEETLIPFAFSEFYREPYYAMNDGDRLRVSVQHATGLQESDFVNGRIEVMIPAFTKRMAGRQFVHFFGLMTVAPAQGTVSRFSLKSKRTDGIDAGTLEYIAQIGKRGGHAVAETATWIGSESDGTVTRQIDFNLKELSFATPDPAVFTLEGCGITFMTSDPGLSGMPLMAWYFGCFAVVCFVAIWIIRRKQKSAR
ncbi:MAG: hypothetical protein R3C19_06015 [Planctomycetaceae bacterium]